ncbi:hypothetical protein Tco_0703231 [Tanacetum coccineum]|uniref:HECT domain-containing protein n=1 Tax=Tanacetum coccineum TaxID=301880 RepID=A0ABQ4Y018_9ASTR
MDDPNITMEEYIRLEEEKARRHGRTFNWQTATFGKVKNYEDEDDHPIDFEILKFWQVFFDNTSTAIQSEPTVYLENEFPAIVYNDGLTSKSDFGIRPLINSECIDEINLIDETSLSEYDEEIVSRFNDLFNDIHPDDLKSEKDDDDNDIGIIQSSEDNEITHGENGFSETSHDKIIKTFETGSFVINLNIVIWNYYVNGMIFFLIINLYVPYGIPFDPKRYYKDGSHTSVAEAKKQYGVFNFIEYGVLHQFLPKVLNTNTPYSVERIRHMAPLPAVDQRHPWLRYQIEEYTEGIRHSYEQRLETIWSRPVNRVHVLDFEGLTAEMRQDLAVRLRMVYFGEGQQVFVSHAWRRLFGIRGPLVREFILEFLSTCRMSDTVMDLDTADTLCFQLGGVRRRMT